MSKKSLHLERFMPYASDRGGLALHHVRAAIDGEPRGELASGTPLSTGPWETLTLSLALELRAGVLTRVLHADELHEPPVAIVLAVRCPATFLSLPQCVKHPNPSTDKYEHVISLRRNEIRGEVSITPHLVRTTTRTPRPGFAARKGAWLAKGDPWILHTDETKPRQGHNLEILRKRFSEVQGILPADHHNWFALQLDGASPRLFLNDEHSAVMAALYDTSTRGKRAAVREALFDQIDATVWPTLLLHAARAWHDTDGDTYAWQENILRLWTRWSSPDEHDLAAGVQRLVQRAIDEPTNFLLEISAVLQRRDQIHRLERLIAGVSQ